MGKKLKKGFKSSWQLYLLLLIPVVYVFIFSYIPMYGATLAFKNFNPMKGIMGSEWTGLKYLQRFFNNPYFGNNIYNTLLISI